MDLYSGYLNTIIFSKHNRKFFILYWLFLVPTLLNNIERSSAASEKNLSLWKLALLSSRKYNHVYSCNATECLNLTFFRTFFIVVFITPQIRQIFVAKFLTNLLRSPFECVFFGRCWFNSCKTVIVLINFRWILWRCWKHSNCCCISTMLSLLIDFIPT